MKIIIELTSFFSSDVITGIQRVTTELTKRLIREFKDVTLIFFNHQINRYKVVDKDSFLNFCNVKNRNKLFKTKKGYFKISEIDKDSILIDIDSCFDLRCYPRFKLYNVVKKNNGKIITFLYDLLPINRPEFWENYQYNFLIYVAAALEFADKIIVNSNAIKLQVLDLCNICGYKKSIDVLPLGSNISKVHNENNVSKKIKDIRLSKYILIVCTIEPRKNHITLIQSYLKYVDKNKLNLVIVGKKGWMYENTLKTLKKSNLLNKNIFLIDDANNDEVSTLYKNAYVFVFPSFDEGYGLPIVEALFYGCPVITSDIPIFREITNNNCIYFDPNNQKQLGEKLNYYLNNTNEYLKLKEKIKNFNVLSWEKCFEIFKNIIKNT